MSKLWLAGLCAGFLLTACGREQPAPPVAATGTDTAPGMPVKTVEEYELVTIINSEVPHLKGISLDAQDNIYAAGVGVRVLSPDGGKVLREWETSGPATCCALDGETAVYVGQQRKVEVFGLDGAQLRVWGKEGRGRGELDYVTAIAVHKTNVLVADAGNRCIHRFDLTGDFIEDIGRRNPEAGLPGIICPFLTLDFAVDKSGALYVTNPGMTRVECYSLGGTLAGFWGEGGTQPAEFSGCCNPTNIALMPDGRIVTAEKITARVKVYDAKGAMLAFIGPQYFTKEAAGLDVAIDSAGRVLVMDPGDGKIRVFERKKRPETHRQRKTWRR